MSELRKLVSVVGARPQFVKLAPIDRALRDHAGVTHRVIHTGQHYDQNMSASFFDQLALPHPDIDLGVGSGSHATQTGDMLRKLESVFTSGTVDAVIVYGDTNSTLAATLAAAKLEIPIAHVEAGLRSFDRSMPEEINRIVADHCSDRLYAPTPRAYSNLGSENLGERAVLSGDVMLDAVLRNRQLAREKSEVLQRLSLESGTFGLATVHRASNTTPATIVPLLAALDAIATKQLPLVFPVHPRTRSLLAEVGYRPSENMHLVEPLPYLDIISLIDAAAIILTDSGGVQKEAAFLHTPCLTLRRETEWTETVELGINYLEADVEKIPLAAAEILAAGAPFTSAVVDGIRTHYGSGAAAQFIVDDCLSWLETDK